MISGVPASGNRKFILLSLIPLYFIIAGLFLQPPDEILRGLAAIVAEPDILITDYMSVAGVGAAFVNAGFMMLLGILFVFCLGMEMDGHTITSACLMFGFSLFGKNLVNIWAILFGVFLYASYHKSHLSNYIYVGLYGTSLSPIITHIMQMVHLPLLFRLLLMLTVGAGIGFVLPPLSAHLHHAHQGYSLYNVGFSGGIIATVIVAAFKSAGIEVEPRLIWSTGNNELLFLILFFLFGSMILGALFLGGRDTVRAYLRILKTSGVSGTDYLRDEGGCAVVFNMGINGLIAMAFVLMARGDLNGPTIGGIFTIVGFSATGKHLRNILPILLGACLASVTGFWDINMPAPMLALLFSTTLAPVAGEFGVLAGLAAGYLHVSVALHIGEMYGGLNLYNNGFAGGIVAIFMVPVIQSIRDRRARVKGESTL